MKKRIVSTLLAFCMMLALLPGTAFAADPSGECGANGGNLTWTLNSGGVLTISGGGSMRDWGKTWAPWHDRYHSNLANIIIGDGATSIGTYAFYNSENLARITIPDSVTSIGNGAFERCVRLPRITLPENLTSIGMYAFYGCQKLASLVIPNLVTSIGHQAFEGCSSLSNVTIPNSVTTIGNRVFVGCTSLTAVAIPNAVDSLNDELFSGCTRLASVTIPTSVEVIGSNVFENCVALKDIYYGGTRQQWENIYIDENNSAVLAKVSIHYGSGGGSTNEHTVTFDANGGDIDTDSITVTNGKNYGTLPTPIRSGFKFNGWYTQITGGTRIYATTKVNLSNDQTLYAHWTKTTTTKTYTITLNANSGKVTPSSIKVESGKTYFDELPTPTRTGYKFDGWYTSKTGGAKITSTTKATANRTIYAHWSRARMLLVTFDGSGGMVDQDQKTVRTGRLYGELPTPTKNNAHFQGWYTKKSGGTKVTETTRVSQTAGHTLYARWGSSATVRNTQRGTYRVTIPTYYDLAIYASSGTAKISSQVETTAYQTITCTQRATLSNGTVRYYGKVNGKTGWFTYSCEMDIE